MQSKIVRKNVHDRLTHIPDTIVLHHTALFDQSEITTNHSNAPHVASDVERNGMTAIMHPLPLHTLRKIQLGLITCLIVSERVAEPGI